MSITVCVKTNHCLLQSGSIVYAWDSLDVEGDDLMDNRDSSGRVVFQHRTVDNLEQDTAYVAKIKVRKNKDKHCSLMLAKITLKLE